MSIRKGDLVMVVRAFHSCAMAGIGKIYRVREVHPAAMRRCALCGERCISDEQSASWEDGKGFGYPLSYLKKIDPDAESAHQTVFEPLQERYYPRYLHGAL